MPPREEQDANNATMAHDEAAVTKAVMFPICLKIADFIDRGHKPTSEDNLPYADVTGRKISSLFARLPHYC